MICELQGKGKVGKGLERRNEVGKSRLTSQTLYLITTVVRVWETAIFGCSCHCRHIVWQFPRPDVEEKEGTHSKVQFNANVH